MQKGENVISLALAMVVVLTFVGIQRQWNSETLKDVAFTAEDFILTSTGIRGQPPDLVGYDTVKTYRLNDQLAALYRQSPAPLVFTTGRFVIYNTENKPIFRLDTLEGSKEAWTQLYDFNGRRGLTPSSGRSRPQFLKGLAGKGATDVVVGQYTGGDHCCTAATVIEIAKDSVTVLGRIDGLDGMPFEGLEIQDIAKDQTWEFVAHRPYLTSCGAHRDAADVLALYGISAKQMVERTDKYPDYLTAVLQQNLTRWRQEKSHSMGLLQTIATDFSMLGQKETAKRFFAMNSTLFLPDLQAKGIDPNACMDEMENLVDRLPSIVPEAPKPARPLAASRR
jgi:hypothetical protein